MAEKKIVYEPHPVSPERKAELVKAGYRIVDAIYAPQDMAAAAKPNDTDDDDLRIAKGPGGRLYIKRGKEIVSGPFASQEEAEAALAAENAG
jgi:hypothetical protein